MPDGSGLHGLGCWEAGFGPRRSAAVALRFSTGNGEIRSVRSLASLRCMILSSRCSFVALQFDLQEDRLCLLDEVDGGGSSVAEATVVLLGARSALGLGATLRTRLLLSTFPDIWNALSVRPLTLLRPRRGPLSLRL